SIACYNCILCKQTCPIGINPYGFLRAAMSDNPDLMIEANSIRLRLGEAFEVDPGMIVRNQGWESTAREALERRTSPESEVIVSRMKAKDAAKYCPLCGNCEKPCPVKLPIMKIIEDLRDDGEFND
ncbi:MAG: 4Fe-4S dicluster domain-containing protein, partial [Desulfobacterales bacterium]|nr:4Fe-4S dicluster domain-containing protein [Desulfobacterales bacterium]